MNSNEPIHAAETESELPTSSESEAGDAASTETDEKPKGKKAAANKPRYANAEHPQIAAVVNKHYRFEEEARAVEKLKTLAEGYTISRQQEENPPKPCVVLWIKDFQITPDEAKNGYMGNYAFVTTEKMLDGLFTLTAVKLDTELKYHPRRVRKTQPIPNWGHPILRNVKKGKVYTSLAAVQDELLQLHLEYPDTTIPGDKKLFLMIYSRSEDSKNPVQKHVMRVEPSKDKEGGFMLVVEKNNYSPPRIEKKEEKQEEAPQGYFTSMIALKRKAPRAKKGASDIVGSATPPAEE